MSTFRSEQLRQPLSLSGSFTGSLLGTASFAENALTASYILKPYRVYTALITQAGNSNPQTLTFDLAFPYPTITVGATYTITQIGINIDFTLIGAPNNNVNTVFVATGTSPGFGDPGAPSILSYNTGAPVVVAVLENTIGNVCWFYSSTGNFIASSDAMFTEDKTYIESSIDSAAVAGSEAFLQHGYVQGDPSSLYFTNVDSTLAPTDDLGRGYVEIRVYN